MPSMANITVKKNDGTTDIVWTAACPSSGDGVAAIWRSETVGSAPAHYPTFELRSRYNGQKTARRMDGVFVYPETATDSTTSLVSVVNRIPFQFTAAIPQGTPSAVINEAVSQFANLLASTLIKDANKAGFAPT